MANSTIRNESRYTIRALCIALPAVCLLLLLQTISACGFEVQRHSNMTSEVLSRHGVSGNSLDMILQGVRWPDLNQCWNGCYCPTYLQLSCTPDPNNVQLFSLWHYDNNMIWESMAHVNLLMDQARAGLAANFPPTNGAQRKGLGEAMITFGKALHGVQDFYAHSTWIELNQNLIRIGGTINSCPMWNGENLAGTVAVGGTTIEGLQTGFVELPTPPGSTTHAALNKDGPGTPQGSVIVFSFFPLHPIGSYYEIASGQVGGTNNPYLDAGLAPQHTLKAWTCLWGNCAIYNLPPQSPPGAATPASVTTTPDMTTVMNWINSDPEMTAAAIAMDNAWASANPDSPSTFPGELFDADGWPLPATTSVGDLTPSSLRLLQGAWPNPARGITSIRFFAPNDGRAKLEVFDLLGRRIVTLFDGEVTRGWKDLRWDGNDASGVVRESGVYRCRLTIAGHTESSSFAILR